MGILMSIYTWIPRIRSKITIGRWGGSSFTKEFNAVCLWKIWRILRLIFVIKSIIKDFFLFIQREATIGAGEVISYLGWIDMNAQVSNMFFCWELISINSSMQLLWQTGSETVFEPHYKSTPLTLYFKMIIWNRNKIFRRIVFEGNFL